MIIRGYKEGDIFHCMSPKQVEDLQITEDYISLLHTWTVQSDIGIIYGCGGFRFIWEGVWEAWLHSKDYEVFFHNKFLIIKEIRHVMKNMFEWEKAYRIQAVVRADNIQSLKFHRLLGFEREGVLRKYGPDKADFIMHSMVR